MKDIEITQLKQPKTKNPYAGYKIFFVFFYPSNTHSFYCPNKEAAMGIIVVSLTYTAYHWGALIAFCCWSESEFTAFKNEQNAGMRRCWLMAVLS